MDMVKATGKDFKALMNLFKAATKNMKKQGIDQWDMFYPNRFVIKRDIRNGTIYCLWEGAQLVAAVALDDQVPKPHLQVTWDTNKALLIHRLVVHPEVQGKGLGKRVLQFAENYARAHNYPSIHLDAYSGNPVAMGMYEKYGYERRGEVSFPMRKLPYVCYEKAM